MIFIKDIERMRDPFVLVDNDTYYLYGTCGICFKNTSVDFSGKWEDLGVVVEKPNIATADFFWAPEVYKYNDAYYMFTSYYSSIIEKRGCAVFKSNSPEGPFVQVSDGTITPADLYCIDGTLYIDKSGQPWMVYSEEYIQAADGIGNMFAAKLSEDLTCFISDPIRLFRGDSPVWSSGKIVEGPDLYRCENGELLMLISGFKKGTDCDRYCVGVARSDNGDIDGNWIVDEALLYSSELSKGYDGGHGMVFKSLTGQLYLSIHSPNYIKGINPKPVFVPIKEENSTLVWDIK